MSSRGGFRTERIRISPDRVRVRLILAATFVTLLAAPGVAPAVSQATVVRSGWTHAPRATVVTNLRTAGCDADFGSLTTTLAARARPDATRARPGQRTASGVVRAPADRFRAPKPERVLLPLAGEAPFLGEGGAQVTSRTLLRGAGRGFRIDVENPVPGFRPGQLHLQDAGGGNYLYDVDAAEFTGLSRSLPRRVANGQLRTGPSATFTYDTLGQRIASTQAGVGTNYTYDQAGRLTSATGPAPTTYTYDADNLRATKTSGITTARYTWSANGGLPQLLSDGSANYIYGPDGIALEQIDSAGTVSYIHHDQLGSTRLLTNPAGNTVAKFTYDPYGTLAASTGSAHTPVGYAGQYTDPETGLIYLRARYYDPNTAQFLTRDPLAALTRQPYGYASNNPLNTTDPSGLAPECPTDAPTDDGADDDTDEAAEAAKAGTDVVRYDPEFASRQLLGQPAADGYAVTPGGRTVSAHAAERIVTGGPGRPPTTLERVDDILDSGTKVTYDPIRDTIRVRAPGQPGKPYVVVSGSNPNHIVTVMVPK